jgi:thiol:disulfide interchange protein DsbD
MRSLLLLALLVPGLALAAPFRTPHVEAELVAERTAAEPGQPLTVALRLKAIPGWHTYWRNPGDSGQPSSLDWKLPAGWSAGAIQWPAPGKLPIGPLANYGYEGEVFLLSSIAVPAGGPAPRALSAHARWLVCNPERCIPEEGELTLALGSGRGGDGPYANEIRYTRELLPQPASGGWTFSARKGERAVELDIGAPAGYAPKTLQFFPYEEGKLQHAAAQPFSAAGPLLRLSLPISTQPFGAFTRVSGILVTPGQPPVEIDVPIMAGVAAASLGLLAALAFAFAGGLILNLMPCVLPVLSIKVLGFAAGKDAAAMRTHGLLYGAGVVLSFLALAALLIALQSAGSALGWGFQLQSPVFVALLGLLFLALALNLSGVFEFGALVPAALAGARVAGPRTDAFLTGVLAVLVASPCTAPFMGAALGYALTESAAVALSVFAALGVGMAAPYVLLAFRPQWLRHLPKPGPWMATLKRWLAVPLYATVVWLAWVFSLQVGLAGPASDKEVWQRFSDARVAELRAQSKPVFIDFTAAWCVTCQVNKQLVLSRPETLRAFRDKGVTLLRADWTRQDPEITRALAALGRNGVPVYVLYRPGRDALLLPEILTGDALRSALAEL